LLVLRGGTSAVLGLLILLRPGMTLPAVTALFAACTLLDAAASALARRHLLGLGAGRSAVFAVREGLCPPCGQDLPRWPWR
jgi:hypothetical protein